MVALRELGRRLSVQSRRKILLAGLVGLTVIGIVIARVIAHRAEAADAARGPPPVPVVTAKAARENLPIFISAIGNVLAAQSVTVRVRVDGQLEKVAFTEGQDVKQGDLLAQIDPRPFQAQLDQAVAQKARDEASLAGALKDLERYTTLVAQDSIQQQTLDNTKTLVGTLKAAVQSDQAQIDNAKTQLSYTTIRAPLSGRTGIRLVDAGNIVHAADASGLVVINQIDPIGCTFTVPEADVQRINQAMRASGRNPLPVQALSRDDGSVLATGNLLVLNNQIDTSTGTVLLKASFPNRAHALWPGQYVNLRLTIGERKDATTVPEAAVQRGPDGLLIYVVRPDESVAIQKVRVANVQDGKAIIDEGIAPDTRIVVEGQSKAQPGSKVVEAKQAPRSAAVAQKSGAPGKSGG